MKAIVYGRYGSFDDLEMRDIAKPLIEADEVLVCMRAAGLHVGDCFAVRGSPFVVRMATSLLRPKHGIPGFDGAGEVEAVRGSLRGRTIGRPGHTGGRRDAGRSRTPSHPARRALRRPARHIASSMATWRYSQPTVAPAAIAVNPTLHGMSFWSWGDTQPDGAWLRAASAAGFMYCGVFQPARVVRVQVSLH